MTDSKVLHCQLEDDATTVDYTGDGYKDCQTCGDLYKPTINPLGNNGEHRARPDCDPATDSPAVDMCDACDQRRIRTQTNGCFKMCPNGLCGYAVEMPLEKKVPAVCHECFTEFCYVCLDTWKNDETDPKRHDGCAKSRYKRTVRLGEYGVIDTMWNTMPPGNNSHYTFMLDGQLAAIKDVMQEKAKTDPHAKAFLMNMKEEDWHISSTAKKQLQLDSLIALNKKLLPLAKAWKEDMDELSKSLAHEHIASTKHRKLPKLDALNDHTKKPQGKYEVDPMASQATTSKTQMKADGSLTSQSKVLLAMNKQLKKNMAHLDELLLDYGIPSPIGEQQAGYGDVGPITSLFPLPWVEEHKTASPPPSHGQNTKDLIIQCTPEDFQGPIETPGPNVSAETKMLYTKAKINQLMYDDKLRGEFEERKQALWKTYQKNQAHLDKYREDHPVSFEATIGVVLSDAMKEEKGKACLAYSVGEPAACPLHMREEEEEEEEKDEDEDEDEEDENEEETNQGGRESFLFD